MAVRSMRPGDVMYLFDENSKSDKSDLFTVTERVAFILRGFNIFCNQDKGERQRVDLMMVAIRPSDNPQGHQSPGDCTTIVEAGTAVVHETCIAQCGLSGPWGIFSDQNLTVISVPGTYRAVLSDPAMMMGTAVVQIQAIESATVGQAIPWDLVHGTLS